MGDLARVIEKKREEAEAARIDTLLTIESCEEALALSRRTLALAKQERRIEDDEGQHRLSKTKSDLTEARQRLKRLEAILRELDGLPFAGT